MDVKRKNKEKKMYKQFTAKKKKINPELFEEYFNFSKEILRRLIFGSKLKRKKRYGYVLCITELCIERKTKTFS